MVKNKVTIITGSTSGIGLDTARLFAQNGAKVVISGRNEEVLDKTTRELRSEGLEVIGIKCDVSKEEEIKSLISKTVEHYGTIHIFVSNAGIQHVASIEDFPTDKFEEILKLMLVGPFSAIKELFPIMKKQKWGRIINMASINGLVGFAGKSAYNSAKHGLLGLTKVAALEGALHGITVNSICPGYVDTPLVRNQLKDLAETRGISVDEVLEKVIFSLVPQKKLLTTDEIANYTMFVASEHASSITGQALVMDGGYTIQ
ncbi:MAG: 3-hydroxybutyrate dehydrogenase [Arcobacter sp.]|nr:3-hydroxybutyrate dehydrogenase [Arcobacter sp.]